MHRRHTKPTSRPSWRVHRWGGPPLFAPLILLVVALTSCASAPTPHARATPTAPHAASATPAPPYAGTTYTDAKLGFRVLVPSGWGARAAPGIRAPAGNTSVILTSGQPGTDRIQIAVFQGPEMAAAFAGRGAPDTRVGPYPAFVGDTSLRQGKVPCLVRIFLAGAEYAVATWCAPDAAAHVAQFERVLATYQPTSAGFAPGTPPAVPAGFQTCGQVLSAYGYDPATSGWGRTLAPPGGSSGWGGYAPGGSVCSNTGSPDHYLFQCTELVNRVNLEQWGLPHIPGSAARYFDYYQDGALHPGTVRDFPDGSYQFADDASQGISRFAPRPGDLLIFQDVADPRAGWTSGLTTSPGHVAIVTGVDATHVYIAQENYNDAQYFMALPLATTARGAAVADRSGLPNRIVRGWIHFTVNGGPAPLP